MRGIGSAPAIAHYENLAILSQSHTQRFDQFCHPIGRNGIQCRFLRLHILANPCVHTLIILCSLLVGAVTVPFFCHQPVFHSVLPHCSAALHAAPRRPPRFLPHAHSTTAF